MLHKVDGEEKELFSSGSQSGEVGMGRIIKNSVSAISEVRYLVWVWQKNVVVVVVVF